MRTRAARERTKTRPEGGESGRLARAAVALLVVLGGACGDSGGFSLGPEAQVDISPNVVAFGDVPRGEIARRIITVRHVGTSGEITLDPIRIETDSPDLRIGLVEATTISPGESTRIQIEYDSAHDEPDEGVLVIGHNLQGNLETRIPISTPGQRAQLVASPASVDFGIVQAGAPRTVDVTILNGGTAPATLTGHRVDGDRDGDFAASVPVGGVIEVGGSQTVSVTYAPSERNGDDAVLTLLTERDDVSITVNLQGEEETPVLVVDPNLVQLGWTRPFEVNSRTVVIRNEGNITLVVSSVELLDAADNLSLTQVPATPFALEPDEAAVFGVIYAPTAEQPMTATPLGTVRIGSNDEARTPYNVPVFGAAGVPSIRVIPEDVVDFAFVAEGFTADRTVVIINEGDSDVTITGATLVEPTTDEFAFPDADLVPRTLNPGDSVELTLTFENRDGADGVEYARFFINTSDPVVPEYPLDVVARRAQRPTCEAAFVPDLLAMGAFRPGSSGQGMLRVVNFGSGDCEYRGYENVGCLAIPFGPQVQFDCDPQIAFNPFNVDLDEEFGDTIGPGGVIDIPVTFNAPTVAPTGFGRDSYYGRVTVSLHDPNSNRFVLVAPPGGWGLGVNLRAEAAIPLIDVSPPRLQFGVVRTDCQSDTRQVRVAATGPMDATITGLEAIGCGPDVTIGAPPLPATVPGFGSIFIDVRLTPQTEGDKACLLRITNDSENLPVVEVPLTGEGTDAARHIDDFLQIPPPKVDVLFVVDDSFSMSDKQIRMRDQLPEVVAIATQWGQDYHLAATTTDTELVRGQFKGVPTFATPETPPEDFADNLVVGTTGHYIEKGLEGAYLALFNRSVRTDIACLNLPGQCPSNDGEGLPLICIEGQCSGRNYGFLRDDAELVIIMVSDEEDSSERPVPFYVNAFANLKAPNSGVGVTLHSIVVTADGCLGSFGVPGFRYIQATEALGGVVANICADSFAGEFEAIAESTFGLRDRFYPTLPPDPDTIEVRVDGVTCASGWSWNNATNAVVFEQGSPCFPGFNDQVELEYDVYCAATAP